MSQNKETVIFVEPGKQELFIIREFDAPRELVFKAHTDPELYAQWVGPMGFTMVIDTFDAKDGGSWRYVSSDAFGNSYSFRGVFHEVLFPERLIGTMEFEGLPEKGHVEFDTAKFEVLDGNRTRLTVQAVYQSIADRDAMVAAGMERGVKDGYNRLDDLLRKTSMA